jgi:hypothetical protein
VVHGLSLQSKEGEVFEMKLYEIAILLLVFMLIVALQFVTAI